MELIEIKGARANNLKNIDVSIPKRKITVFTGVSGSGKSSLVFETIAQEAGRQLNETFPNFTRLFLPRYSQPDADSIENLSAAIVVDQNRMGGNARSTLGTVSDINSLLRLLFSRFGQPRLGYGNQFSFNDPAGMCPNCDGIGKIVGLDPAKAIDKDKSLNEGAILLPGYTVGGWLWKSYAQSGFFDVDKKIRDYSEQEYEKLVYAQAEKMTMNYMDGEISSKYEGLAEKFARQNINTEREKSEDSKKKLEKFTKSVVCPDCEGQRYNKKALSSKVIGYSIFDMTDMQIDALLSVLRSFDSQEAQPIVSSIIFRLQNLVDIGLDYVSLTRETQTLSGGESQRVKMVKHLYSGLTDMLYIFDEPSIGLHPRDIHRLNELLVKLRDKGNTVLVVEHDPDVMKIADHVVDMGPLAGAGGGKVVYCGSFEGLKSSNTLTGKFLDQHSQLKPNPRPFTESFKSSKSSLHNLKNISLCVPKDVFTVVTGVAGSGKSSLVNGVFASEFPQAVLVDQSAAAANIRSNPATFSGAMDSIRQCFASENGVSAGLFSYNSEGACEACKGIGTIELNLSFMDKMEVPCEECGGKRYKREVLNYKYKGKDIVQVMEMTIAEAVDFFDKKDIISKLKSVYDVGLHYMTLGQPLNTLSGGECQRLKLARELTKKGSIYILDEPTTGLHMSDIQTLLSIVNRLVDKGNTVIAIEHNLDVMKNADWIIDLGPDGGINGGEIVFEGTPEALLNCERSITAQYLRASLD